MKIKVKFKAVSYHGGRCSFIENIEVPDDLTTVEEQDDYINELNKSYIIDKRNLYCISDFFRYVKKPRGEKKPNWKDVAAKWELACGIAEQNTERWKKIAIDYRSYIEQYITGEKLKRFTDVEEPIIDELPVKLSSIDTDKPVIITDNYSGGWLAPNGDFYGMDGEYEDMIHNKLADKLLELGLIPEDKDGHNPDSWLCDNGWVKIHIDWILYDGYLKAKRSKIQEDYNMPVIQAVPMTKEQRDQIALYGALCWGGALKFGLEKNYLSIARFKMTEAPMLWKLFDF